MKCEHEFITKFGGIECQKCGAEFDEVQTNTKFGIETEYLIRKKQPKQNTMTIEQARQKIKIFNENAKNGTIIYDEEINEAILMLIKEKISHNPTSETIGFDWDCLPKWSDRWIAMDSNKDWNCYSERPTKDETDPSIWVDRHQDTIMTEIPFEYNPTNFTGDWKDSLFLNPKYK